MFAMYPYLTFYLQNDLGYSPIQGGVRILPSSLLCFVVPLAFRSAAERIAPRWLLGAGLGITAVGLATMLAVGAGSSWVVLVPGLLITGLGIGIVNPAIARTALGVVAPERSGMASGISNTFRIGGLATGVAALGAIFQRRVSTSLGANLGHPAPGLAKIVASAGVHSAVVAASGQAGIATAGHDAFVTGLRLILVIGAAVVAVGAIICAALVHGQDFEHRESVVAPVEAALSAHG
jgi:hypothetical protein